MLRDTVAQHGIRQGLGNLWTPYAAPDPNGQAFPGGFIDQDQKLQGAPIIGRMMDKVIRPDMLGMGRPEPDTRPVI